MFVVRRHHHSLGTAVIQRILCGSLYPKPMVTPVHRFQSLEGVTHSAYRTTRSPGYHARHAQRPSVHYNGSSSNIRMPQMGRSLEMVAPGNTPSTTRNPPTTTSKLKCGVWIFFAVVAFLLASVKYYFHEINIGMEALVFCSLFLIAWIIGGLVSFCETMTSSYSRSNSLLDAPHAQMDEQHGLDNNHIPPPAPALSQNSAEMPPPPYHIAVMLSPTNDLDAIQVIGDSPPPSYEKAVT
ncbi:hypothetical protein NQ317_008677 [Molorchus minor]|uniref:Uncharacterized protein n=1 Tax=Molorchus minor TaxID=1323400 RepID=A0ABQ9K056_9CUCU|nr:hypothetical protein NQ317_008677 [Molorchus minor]